MASASPLIVTSCADYLQLRSLLLPSTHNEVVRGTIGKLEAYVEEMASGDTTTASVNMQKIQDDVLKLWTVV